MQLRAPIVAALALAACHGGARERAKRTHELQACTRALERAAQLAPEARLVAVARGCAPACAGLAPWADATDGTATAPRSWRHDWMVGAGPVTADPGAATAALVDGCAPCMGAPKGAAWPQVAAQCGPAAFGLGKDRAYLASTDWWILSRIAAWLGQTRGESLDDAQLAGETERAADHLTFALPLPARSAEARYVLPSSALGRRTDARIYVVVGAQLRAGAVPLARLRGPDLDVRTGPGGDFPAQQVDDGQIGQVFAEDVALVGADGGDTARPPLLLIDEHATLARIAEVFASLGVARAEVAVGGDAALAHPVLLERASSETAAVPTLIVRADAIAIQGFGDDRTTTWAALPDELDHFAAVNAPVRRLALDAQAPLDAQQLVAILDACARAHVASIVVPSR